MNKYIILLVLTSSLPLNSMFNTVKKIGKTTCAIPLTCLTVDYARINSQEKESVAKHEAGHAIASLEKEMDLICTWIKKDSMNKYTGLAHSQIKLEDCTKDTATNAISVTFAGAAQDLKDKNLFERLNFMELELGLPLTRNQRQLSDDLEYIHGQQNYTGDLKYAYKIAYSIAESEILHCKNDNYESSNSSEKKLIEDRVQTLLLQGLQDAKTVVNQNQSKINAVAQALYDKEFLSGDEVKAIIKNCK